MNETTWSRARWLWLVALAGACSPSGSGRNGASGSDAPTAPEVAVVSDAGADDAASVEEDVADASDGPADVGEAAPDVISDAVEPAPDASATDVSVPDAGPDLSDVGPDASAPDVPDVSPPDAPDVAPQMPDIADAAGADVPPDAGSPDVGAPDAGGPDAGVPDVPHVCTPDCAGKDCGDDGCGDTCGSCEVGEECSAGLCAEVVAPGDSCAAPFVIDHVPGTWQGSTTGAANDAYAPFGKCSGISGSVGGGVADQVYRLTAEVAGTYRFTLKDTFGGVLYAATDCADVAKTCKKGSYNSSCSSCPEELEIAMGAGQTIFVWVDGVVSSFEGDYTLTVEVCQCGGKKCGDNGCGGVCGVCEPGSVCVDGGCPPDAGGAEGDTCPHAFPIDASPFDVWGNTSDANNDYSYEDECPPEWWSKGGALAGDDAYVFTPPASGTYTIELLAQFDAAVYVVKNCGNVNGTCLGVRDAVCSGCIEQVKVSLTKGQTCYVIVDGANTSQPNEGVYNLKVSAPACTPSCFQADCGFDGCGGTCGELGCTPGQSCDDTGDCVAYGAGNSCETAFVVDTLPYSARSSTLYMTDHYSFGGLDCPSETDGGGAGASDHVYRFTAPARGRYTARLKSEIGYDMALYMVSDCADVAGTCGGASNGLCASNASCTETVATIMDAGETWYYVVDGTTPGEEGSYGFSLEQTCKAACDSKECGYDPCVGSCGSCPGGQTCSLSGLCVP